MDSRIRPVSTGRNVIVPGSQDRPFPLEIHRIVFQDYVEAVWTAQERRDGLIERIAAMTASWSSGPLVEALRGPRGIDLLSAATFIATTGDLSRFESPRMLMGYLGLVPSEHSSGGSIRCGGISKTVNREARRMLIEAAWTYRYPARVAKDKTEILVRLPKNVRDKFCDHLPLYRQSTIYAQEGVDLDRSTLASRSARAAPCWTLWWRFCAAMFSPPTSCTTTIRQCPCSLPAPARRRRQGSGPTFATTTRPVQPTLRRQCSSPIRRTANRVPRKLARVGGRENIRSGS